MIRVAVDTFGGMVTRTSSCRQYPPENQNMTFLVGAYLAQLRSCLTAAPEDETVQLWVSGIQGFEVRREKFVAAMGCWCHDHTSFSKLPIAMGKSLIN